MSSLEDKLSKRTRSQNNDSHAEKEPTVVFRLNASNSVDVKLCKGIYEDQDGDQDCMVMISSIPEDPVLAHLDLNPETGGYLLAVEIVRYESENLVRVTKKNVKGV